MHLGANTIDHNPLIPLTSTDEGVQAVMGRNLHEFLGIGRDYTNWFKQMAEYGFEQGVDYLAKNGEVQDSLGRSRQRHDHVISLDMAKEISMIQRTEKGKQARQYFLECERRAKESPALSGKQLMAAALLEAQSTMRELEVTNQQQAEQLAAAAPAVEYHDTYVTDEDYLYFSDVASTLGIQESELRELLISHKWIYAEAYTRWSEKKNKKEVRRRYTEYAHKKPYFHRAKNHKVPRFMGTVMHTLMITPEGAAAIKRAVEKWTRPDQEELDLGGRNAA